MDGKHLPGVDLQGNGHASFFTDTDGNRLIVFCAFPFNSSDKKKDVNGILLVSRQKAKACNAYILPWTIDYSRENGTGRGVFRAGEACLDKILEN